MTSEKIEIILSELKPNIRGQIRGKNKAVSKLYSEYLKKIDSELMDIRIFVAKLSTGHTTGEALKMVDEFIYQKQVK